MLCDYLVCRCKSKQLTLAQEDQRFANVACLTESLGGLAKSPLAAVNCCIYCLSSEIKEATVFASLSFLSTV